MGDEATGQFAERFDGGGKPAEGDPVDDCGDGNGQIVRISLVGGGGLLQGLVIDAEGVKRLRFRVTGFDRLKH